MQKIEQITGTGVPLLLDDIDTDRIIPARMKSGCGTPTSRPSAMWIVNGSNGAALMSFCNCSVVISKAPKSARRRGRGCQ